MGTLTDALTTPTTRPRTVETLVLMVEAEIKAKGGLSGAALKAGLSAVRKISPDLIYRAVNGMLGDFLDALQPHWDARSGQSFAAYAGTRAAGIADALLAVTDERARRPHHGAIAKVYNGLRPRAKAQVEESVPRLAAAIDDLMAGH